MDKTIRMYRSLEAMKADEYRAWQKLQPTNDSPPPQSFPLERTASRSRPRMFPPDFKELLSVFNSRKIRCRFALYAAARNQRPGFADQP